MWLVRQKYFFLNKIKVFYSAAYWKSDNKSVDNLFLQPGGEWDFADKIHEPKTTMAKIYSATNCVHTTRANKNPV